MKHIPKASLLFLSSIAALFAALFLFMPNAHAQTQPVPFTCDGSAYVSQFNTTSLFSLDQSMVPYDFSAIGGDSGTLYNALGYNVNDDLLYGYDRVNKQIVQIDSTGALFPIGAISGLPFSLSATFPAGDVGPLGFYHVYDPIAQRLFNVDLSDPMLTANEIILAGDGGFPAYDIAINPNDGMIYSIASDPTSTTTIELKAIDPGTGVVTTTPIVGPITSAQGAIGAMWFDDSDNLYAYINEGSLYRIDVMTGLNGFLSTGPEVSTNDGAACGFEYTPIPFACDGTIYISQEANTQLNEFNTGNSPWTLHPVGTPAGFLYNAIGYSEADDLIYGWDRVNNQVIQIDAVGATFPIGQPVGIPMSGVVGFANGDVDDMLNYYVYDAVFERLFMIDLMTLAANEIVLIGDGSFEAYDMVYNTSDDLLYSISSSDVNPTPYELKIIDPVTGVVSTIVITGDLAGQTGAIGAMWINDSNTLLYAYLNNGAVYEVDPGTGDSIILSTAVSTNTNDGTTCGFEIEPTAVVLTSTSANVSTSTVGLLVGVSLALLGATFVANRRAERLD